MRLLNRYLTKRDGKFYFDRRVPEDVKALNPSGLIREALKTSDLATARKLRDRRVSELEALWDAYRVLPKDDRAGAVEAVAGSVLVSAEQGSPVEGQRTATSVAASEFLARANLKPSTKSLYGKVLKQLAAEFPCLEDLDRPSVRQFLQSYSKDRTAKAVRNLIAASRSLSAFHGFDPGVFSGHRIDAGRESRIKGIWTDSEAFRLAHAHDSPQWLKDCIIVALHSGLRRQEICGLTYDAENDQLVVEAGQAKTANSVRRIPCHGKVREAAKRLADLRPRIDPQRLTKAMQTNAARLKITQVIEIDGVPHKRDFHAIRHTFASKLASLRIEESTIAKLLGHAPLNVTGRYAGKVDSEVFRSVVERVSYW